MEGLSNNSSIILKIRNSFELKRTANNNLYNNINKKISFRKENGENMPVESNRILIFYKKNISVNKNMLSNYSFKSILGRKTSINDSESQNKSKTTIKKSHEDLNSCLKLNMKFKKYVCNKNKQNFQIKINKENMIRDFKIKNYEIRKKVDEMLICSQTRSTPSISRLNTSCNHLKNFTSGVFEKIEKKNQKFSIISIDSLEGKKFLFHKEHKIIHKLPKFKTRNHKIYDINSTIKFQKYENCQNSTNSNMKTKKNSLHHKIVENDILRVSQFKDNQIFVNSIVKNDFNESNRKTKSQN